MKLTKRQTSALRDIDQTVKSGMFWDSIGHRYQTLVALERMGLIETEGSMPGAPISRCRIFTTEAGRRALAQEGE